MKCFIRVYMDSVNHVRNYSDREPYEEVIDFLKRFPIFSLFISINKYRSL